jgi:S-adenosylmethionine:tRNA ribosyltransferase-isomerase
MSAPAFQLPQRLEAGEPPEARGLRRDGVRLMVASASDSRVVHAAFNDLPDVLDPGDLLVVNVSATLPAAITAGRRDGSALRVHVATRAPQLDQAWRVVELRTEDGSRPLPGRSGEHLALEAGASLELVAPYASGARLMLGRFRCAGAVEDHLARYGRPIRYGHARHDLPLAAYQNVYARIPGSAEMPSAGRPFTPELITRLVASGVLFAPITLHCGVSSPERHEPPFPEQYEVPERTAQLVRAVRGWGGRVIAVGTTVVRALETAAEPIGAVQGAYGWTGLVIRPERGVQTIDGLITGWHEPEASHLQMLEALAGPDFLAECYDEALERAYLWHEFGDSHLLLR